MLTDGSGGVIVHAIQLAIAPVFLLSGIAALLGVMANRLARIIDRARARGEMGEFRRKGTRGCANGS